VVQSLPSAYCRLPAAGFSSLPSALSFEPDPGAPRENRVTNRNRVGFGDLNSLGGAEA